MRPNIIAATIGLVLTAATGSVRALDGFTLKLDPAGAGPAVDIVNPEFLNGNAVARNSVTGTVGLGSGQAELFAHAFHPLDVGGELTFNLALSDIGTIISGGEVGLSQRGAGRIDMYYDSTGDARSANGATPVGDEYVNGVRILSGSVDVSQAAGAGVYPVLFASTCPTLNACVPDLAANNATDTMRGSGSLVFDIRWDYVNPAYVRQDLTDDGLAPSVFTMSTNLPYPDAVYASQLFDGGAVTVNYGDAGNDLECASAFQTCDFQFSAAFTTDWAAVPLPATGPLLLGAMVMLGLRRREDR